MNCDSKDKWRSAIMEPAINGRDSHDSHCGNDYTQLSYSTIVTDRENRQNISFAYFLNFCSQPLNCIV